MDNMKQAHFFSLPLQGNVYTIKALQLANKTNKLLVASLKRNVYYFEYVENSEGSLIPTAREISFTYIPSGAEIISIDAFNKSEDGNDFVIGITIIKNGIDNIALETYLNIYSEWEEPKDFNMENIAQNCLNVKLNFTPYHLTHTYLVTWKDDEIISREIVFVLSGGDNQVHVYRENAEKHSYTEVDAKETFPEFQKAPSVVLWLQVYYYDGYTRRVTAFGCECGYLRLTNVCCRTNEILFNLSTKFIGPITTLQIYSGNGALKQPSCLDRPVDPDRPESLNLVVVNSILPSVVFRDIIRCGLKSYVSLRRTELISVSTCLTIGDVDFDGEEEILIGNSLETIQSYKIWNNQARMLECRKLVSPLLNLQYIDITGDGVKELIVFTMKGVYILQHDANYIQKVLEKKAAGIELSSLKLEQITF